MSLGDTTCHDYTGKSELIMIKALDYELYFNEVIIFIMSQTLALGPRLSEGIYSFS